MNREALSVLQELNFTEYEAKAYLTLLEKAPLTGYAVSLHSGVPRSKIYEVLGGLVDRGEVMVSHDTPALYTPLQPDELLAKRKRRTEESLKKAGTALKRYSGATRNRDNIWNISGREAILDKARDLLRGAEQRILVEIWSEEAEELRREFQDAGARGVEIIVVAYGEMNFEFARVYHHDSSAEITEEYGGRWLVLCVDDREVVAGTVSLGQDSRAAWTAHPGLVVPVIEIIVHDIYIMEILAKHRDIVEASFGPNLQDLRKRFNIDSAGLSIAEKIGLRPNA